VHESGFGTKRTCLPRRSMSAFEGKADVHWPVSSRASVADDPKRTMAGRDQAGRRLIVRHAAWRNTRRCLLDKTQSAAALFAVTKST
jgi:hypothetical protein